MNKHKSLKKICRFLLTGIMVMSAVIYPYAAKNSLGTANQLKTRISNSLDIDGLNFSPHYYDPNKIFAYGIYSFVDLDLDDDQMRVLTMCFNALIEYGFSEEAAAGACGNLWQETDFHPESGVNGIGVCGIVQWGGDRRTGLENLAKSEGKAISDLDVQIEYMLQELDGYYGKALNQYLDRFGYSSSYKTIDDVQIACDAWCAEIEKCTCRDDKTGELWHSPHNKYCASAANGTEYQHLNKRREYSEKIYSAMVRQTLGISEYGLSVPDNDSNNAVPYIPQSGGYPWAAMSFGDGTVASSGCSITSFSMVISYWRGEWKYPNDMIDILASEHDGNYNYYHTPKSGPNGPALFGDLASYFGCRLEWYSINRSDSLGPMTQAQLDSYLLSGIPVIVSVGSEEIPSYKNISLKFTSGSHFIVITGMDANGYYYVNDPNHPDYSIRYKFTWNDFDTCQNSGFYAIYPAAWY